MPKYSEKRKKDEDDEMQLNKVESDLEEEEDDESCDDESVENEEMEFIETEFEAYLPLPEDKEGMKALLKQLFKKETIELGLLTEHLIDERLCIVVKQLVDEEIEEEDVFSLSALVELNKKELIDKPFIKLINKFLIRTAKESGSNEIVQLLEDKNQNKVLILNERFINLPPKLGRMSLQNLLDEAKNQNLKSDYYILICKLLKTKDESSVKKKKNKKSKVSTDENEFMYLNAEDEIFSENAIHKYEFKIADDNSDITVNQNWKSGQQYVPFRRVLLLNENGFNNSLKQLKEEELKKEADE